MTISPSSNTPNSTNSSIQIKEKSGQPNTVQEVAKGFFSGLTESAISWVSMELTWAAKTLKRKHDVLFDRHYVTAAAIINRGTLWDIEHCFKQAVDSDNEGLIKYMLSIMPFDRFTFNLHRLMDETRLFSLLKEVVPENVRVRIFDNGLILEILNKEFRSPELFESFLNALPKLNFDLNGKTLKMPILLEKANLELKRKYSISKYDPIFISGKERLYYY